MLVYLVGQWSFVDGNKEEEPYYFGYTTNQQIAHIYYDLMVKRVEKGGPSNVVTDMVFIREMSYSKFTNDDSLKYVEEIEEYSDGIYMTASDFEYLSDSISACYDEITHYLADKEHIQLFIKKLKKYAKYSKKKSLKKSIDNFIDATNNLYKHFSDFEDACEDIKWDKAQRKFW